MPEWCRPALHLGRSDGCLSESLRYPEAIGLTVSRNAAPSWGRCTVRSRHSGVAPKAAHADQSNLTANNTAVTATTRLIHACPFRMASRTPSNAPVKLPAASAPPSSQSTLPW